MKPLVVICSQDADFYLLLSHILDVDGFDSAPADCIDDVPCLAMEQPVEAVVLDCRPDNQVAAESARLGRHARTSTLPVVALLAPGAENQHTMLLRAGIEERLTRPVAPVRLLQYLRSRLAPGRAAEARPAPGRALRYRDIEMQLETHRVYCNGEEIRLGPIEFKLLRHLLHHPEKVLSRGELMAAAWAADAHVGSRTVDVHISALRTALRQFSHVATIRTVRLAGYALDRRPSLQSEARR